MISNRFKFSQVSGLTYWRTDYIRYSHAKQTNLRSPKISQYIRFFPGYPTDVLHLAFRKASTSSWWNYFSDQLDMILWLSMWACLHLAQPTALWQTWYLGMPSLWPNLNPVRLTWFDSKFEPCIQSVERLFNRRKRYWTGRLLPLLQLYHGEQPGDESRSTCGCANGEAPLYMRPCSTCGYAIGDAPLYLRMCRWCGPSLLVDGLLS